ncbi:uncharacterized protein T551_00344 [Pneumocystis jirovecii RU7]|uniref:Cryptic loci regulator 2 N-terminal domain-containing protein n=2 Tax=Pneumocystis jirovecii TaxID=42068 RepID=A0A0W4ZV56_PNEJ7|nr:uncharacterized protein T551_00344 [Pneumocystis jirovecii RU7]KTW32253.1 hypothetical protein T551_00344 [Pneumocystis jirovecii RU7]
MPIPPAYPETHLKRIQIHWSDGVTTGYPPASSCNPTVNEDGTFDFFRKIATGESKDLHWRRKCAEYLREQAKIQAFQGMDFVLDAFPKNYKLYEHCKRYNDARQERRDTFLFGHPKGIRFRSPAEFSPHLLWIAQSKTHERGECPCKYCGGDPKSWNRRKNGSDQMQIESTHDKLEREADLCQEGALYRPGEVVWMIQDNPNDEWVVCIVIDRTVLPCVHLDGVSSKSYSYRVRTVKAEKKTMQVPQWMLRPLLSRSLNGMKDLEDLCETWSLFGSYMSGVSPKIHCYSGCWIGPEKIWRGDIVRFKKKSDPQQLFSIFDNVLVINSIYKENKSGNILVSGNAWYFTSTPCQIDPLLHIPQKLAKVTEVLNICLGCSNTKDIEFTCSLFDIQGRWYEPWLIPKGTILNEIILKRKINTRKEAFTGELNLN